MFFPVVLLGVAVAPPPVPPPQLPAPVKTMVAEGIYLFSTAPYSDVGLDGNSVAILSDDGVLVFDANGTPAAAALVLAEIRKLTNQPVRYLVYSHWHWDHWYGAEVYRKAFPGLTVISHAKARELMAGPAIEFNRPGIEQQLPGHIADVERRAASVPAADRSKVEAHLAADRFFLAEKRGVTHILADLTYTDSLTLHLGRREIRVLHQDRAVTPGDTYLYLPAERIVVAGDLVVNPISFALSSYPAGWLRTLEAIDRLDAAVIVPGHGGLLHDESLLHAHVDLFRELIRRGRDARSRGLDPDQAKAEILPTLSERRTRFTGGDRKLDPAFDIYLVDWFLHRVYDEAGGEPTDAIAPIPPG